MLEQGLNNPDKPEVVDLLPEVDKLDVVVVVVDNLDVVDRDMMVVGCNSHHSHRDIAVSAPLP